MNPRLALRPSQKRELTMGPIGFSGLSVAREGWGINILFHNDYYYYYYLQLFLSTTTTTTTTTTTATTTYYYYCCYRNCIVCRQGMDVHM